jgi:hypothetical protein
MHVNGSKGKENINNLNMYEVFFQGDNIPRIEMLSVPTLNVRISFEIPMLEENPEMVPSTRAESNILDHGKGLEHSPLRRCIL